MTVAEAVRQLVRRRVTKPEWLVWTHDQEIDEWILAPDHVDGYSVEVTWGLESVLVQVDHREKPSDQFEISYAEPDSDLKIATIIVDWLRMVWEETQLDLNPGGKRYRKPALKALGADPNGEGPLSK